MTFDLLGAVLPSSAKSVLKFILYILLVWKLAYLLSVSFTLNFIAVDFHLFGLWPWLLLPSNSFLLWFMNGGSSWIQQYIYIWFLTKIQVKSKLFKKEFLAWLLIGWWLHWPWHLSSHISCNLYLLLQYLCFYIHIACTVILSMILK